MATTKRRLPNRIPHGHTSLELERPRAMKGEDYGDFDSELKIIRVKAGIPDDEALNTLLHELGHAAWYTDDLGSGIDDPDGKFEERIARCVGNRISEAIMRSAELRRWIGSLRP